MIGQTRGKAIVLAGPEKNEDFTWCPLGSLILHVTSIKGYWVFFAEVKAMQDGL